MANVTDARGKQGLWKVYGDGEGLYCDGKKIGKWTYWHSNGQMVRQGCYELGLETGEWTWWYKTGEVHAQGDHNGGYRKKWTSWYENGQLEENGQYDVKGERIGLWIEWTSDGSLYRYVEYNGGGFTRLDWLPRSFWKGGCPNRRPTSN